MNKNIPAIWISCHYSYQMSYITDIYEDDITDNNNISEIGIMPLISSRISAYNIKYIGRIGKYGSTRSITSAIGLIQLSYNHVSYIGRV